MIRGNATAAVAALRSLQKTLERLAYVPRKVAVIAAPRLTKLVQAQFRAGVDPYGVAWRPLRPATIAKGRRSPPLTDTRRLRNGTKASARSGGRAGLVLKAGAPYGAFHQVGFRVGRTRVAPRRIFPQRGLPAAWRAVLDAAARQAAREARAA
jgi:phage gpG-like protein